MANFLYDKAREAFLKGDLDWLTQTFKVVGVSSGYTPTQASDDFLADITAGNRLFTSDALANKTATAGVADADNVTVLAVDTGGVDIDALVIIRDSGAEATSELVAYIDSGTGLPLPTNGGDVTINWHANGIFKL